MNSSPMRHALRLIFSFLLIACCFTSPRSLADELLVQARHGRSWRGVMDGVPVLALRGTHRERGVSHGMLAGKEVVRSCNHLAQTFEKRIEGGWQRGLNEVRRFDLPPRFLEELEGLLYGIQRSTTPNERRIVATQREITIADLKVLNTVDIFEAFQCSQFSAWGRSTKGGMPIVGRNFDYPAILPRETFCVLSVEPSEPGLHATVDPLWFGVVGSGIAAMRDDGLYVAPNSGGRTKGKVTIERPTACGFVLRSFLESADPDRVAEDFVAQVKSRVTLSLLFHLVPPRGQLRDQSPMIVEYDPTLPIDRRARIRRPETSDSDALFVANHCVFNAADLSQGRCGIMKNELEKRKAQGVQLDFDEGLQILHAARQSNTLVTVVAWPHAQAFKVAIAEPGKVATESRFANVDWKAILAKK